MSEEFALSNLQSVPPTDTAGALLRAAREASGLHIAALAVAMKVPVKKLEALEADRLDLLPDAVFVRALASSMCRTLKIDPAPILARLPQTAIPRLDTEERGINEPFQASSHTSGASLPEAVGKPVFWLALLFLVGAVLVMVLPRIPGLDRETESNVVVTPVTENNAPEPQAAPAPAQTLVEAPVAVPAPAAPAPQAMASAPAPVAASTPAVAAVAAAAKPPASAAPAPATVLAVYRPASAPATVAASAPAAKPLAAAGTTVDLAGSTNGVVVFKARGTSWVEVTDAKGVVQLRKTLFNGETSGASGALPLSVVIGRADVTSVEVRGKPFALAAIARDNVARFEVK